jgi:hypothetical protein
MKIRLFIALLLLAAFRCIAQSEAEIKALDIEAGKLNLTIVNQQKVPDGTVFDLKDPDGKARYTVCVLSFDDPDAAKKRFRAERNQMSNAPVLKSPVAHGDETIITVGDNVWTGVMRFGSSVLWMQGRFVSYEDSEHVLSRMVEIFGSY